MNHAPLENFKLSRRQLLSRASLLSCLPLANINYAQVNTTLERQLISQMSQLRRNHKLSTDETIALVVTDIKKKQILCSINENKALQCASLVKPFVIQAYMYCHFQKDAKLYPLNQKIKDEMKGMIVDSNNTFTNYIFKRLGGPQGVQWMLKKEAPHIFKNIHIVENIPQGGRTYKNKASAGDYTRFLYATWFNQLPGSTIIKELMGIKNHDRLVSRTDKVPKNTLIYDKTGSTAMLCGNYGILNYPSKKHGHYPYSVSCVIEKSSRANNYSQWITARSNVMRGLSDTIYLDFQRRIG